MTVSTQSPTTHHTVFFGTGCFWCTEAVFGRLHGVIETEPGFMGGGYADVTYEEVCRGNTGHAEVLRIVYDPQVVSFERLIDIFWRCHDPTSLNRQGHDIGPQYRSCIFVEDEETLQRVQLLKVSIDASGVFPRKTVTQIERADHFVSAGPAHKDYFARFPNKAYCAAVIRPKLDQLSSVLPPL
jgi:peptide-methionine (S)-S-oxide reductase